MQTKKSKKHLQKNIIMIKTELRSSKVTISITHNLFFSKLTKKLQLKCGIYKKNYIKQ